PARLASIGPDRSADLVPCGHRAVPSSVRPVLSRSSWSRATPTTTEAKGYPRPVFDHPSAVTGQRSVARIIDIVLRDEPVLTAVDLAWHGRIARVLRPDDAVPLELVHHPARPRESKLELRLEHRG